MSSSEHEKKLAPASHKSEGGKAEKGKRKEPDWTSGLKRLYDQVVDEPLPDSFNELLSKLDKNEGK
ncbi:hypothetical protein EG799_09870 [Aurantiacibacter spongiae]|uniref:Anti-sigma factor NepR domain-containing protein n=2 Tax=Aurantiacibacter spongiae TaxID=2488860 RepID=A0A3N5CU85_9SPHN|nr:hypothetical protein EG799_09870 [Aurantiacibacter spongiae]